MGIIGVDLSQDTDSSISWYIDDSLSLIYGARIGCSRWEKVRPLPERNEFIWVRKVKEVNRSLVVIKPRQSYVDWANSFMDDDKVQSIDFFHRDCTAYLIDEIEEERDKERILKTVYRRIFEEELYAWMTDESVWPEKRDYPTFRAWFDVAFHSLVFDLCDDG